MRTNLILDASLAFFALSTCRTDGHVFRRKTKFFILRARICECIHKHIHVCKRITRKTYQEFKDRLLEWEKYLIERIKKSDFRFNAVNDSWLKLADGITGGKIYENE